MPGEEKKNMGYPYKRRQFISASGCNSYCYYTEN